MTDNEIIKALECCGSDCYSRCPLWDFGDDSGISQCTTKLARNALDLIKKQKAILEAIDDTIHPLPFITDFDVAIKTAKAEAVREFAERVKGEKWNHKNFGELVCVEDIDILLEEMEKENL